MGIENNTGVFQLESGTWAFRYTFNRNGKRVSKQVSKDEAGNPLKSRRAAIRARQVAIDREQNAQKPKPKVRKTVAEGFQEYSVCWRNQFGGGCRLSVRTLLHTGFVVPLRWELLEDVLPDLRSSVFPQLP